MTVALSSWDMHNVGQIGYFRTRSIDSILRVGFMEPFFPGDT